MILNQNVIDCVLSSATTLVYVITLSEVIYNIRKKNKSKRFQISPPTTTTIGHYLFFLNNLEPRFFVSGFKMFLSSYVFS